MKSVQYTAFAAIAINLVLLVCGAHAEAAPASLIRKANHDLKQGNLGEAAEIYKELLEKYPQNHLIHFNNGAVHYGKGDYDAALHSFESAQTTQNQRLKQASIYNIAGALFQAAGKTPDNQEKIPLLTRALEHYRQAIAMNARDLDAKYNYEVTRQLLKDTKDAQKSPSQDKSESKDQDETDRKSEDGRKKETEGEDAQKTEEDRSSAQRSDESPSIFEDENTPLTHDEPQEQDSQTPGSSQKEQKMTSEEAAMLIRQYGRENKPLFMPGRDPQTRQMTVEKDW